MIWCDLDNTLIWTWDPQITSPLLSAAFGLPIEHRPPRGRGRRKLVKISVPGLGSGYVCARRHAVSFLRELRRIDRVRMLTSAVRAYAVAMNSAFELGFADDELTTREDLARGASAAVDPAGVLIDNEAEFSADHAHDMSRVRKLRFLGVTPSSVVEVPYFRGTTDDDFDRRWRQYVEQVRRRMPAHGE